MDWTSTDHKEKNLIRSCENLLAVAFVKNDLKIKNEENMPKATTTSQNTQTAHYSGGQFVPGGGQAPKGGCIVTTTTTTGPVTNK